MIKSLFGEDEPAAKPEKLNDESEESIKRQLAALNLAPETIPPKKEEAPSHIDNETPLAADAETPNSDLSPENQILQGFPAADADTSAPATVAQVHSDFAELLESPADETATRETIPPPTQTTATTDNQSFSPPASRYDNLFQTDTQPLTTAETIRQSGMAWSAAVGLFGSILFMLILGWFFDVLTGASPWGLVGGIMLGALIGFYQFFRVTSQIFKK